MCSIFGVIATKPAAPEEVLAFSQLGGQYLQHRGHEWVGIAHSNGEFLNFEKFPGLVVSLFANLDIRSKILKNSPQMMLMQTRFSTQGESTKLNAQPHWRRSLSGALALGSNGDVFNYAVERKRLESSSVKFISKNDSEVQLLQIMLSAGNDIDALPDGIREMMRTVRSSYSSWLATEDVVYLFRDQFGNRPMYYMEVDGYFFFASEDCALTAILKQRAELDYLDGVVDICQVLPGEIIKVRLHGKVEYLEGLPRADSLAHCTFERIYFARPDSTTFGDHDLHLRVCYRVEVRWDEDGYALDYQLLGQTNADFRSELGKKLASESPVDADLVIPVPDSGNFAALGYSEASDIRFMMGLVRSSYVTRTFITPGRDTREKLSRLKYQVLPHLFTRYPRIILVDDSLVFGTTMEKVVAMCKAAGAKEVHVRITCPPIVSPCRYGVDMESKGELLAAKQSVEDIRRQIKATSLYYLSLPGLKSVLGDNEAHYCFACWNGEFRI